LAGVPIGLALPGVAALAISLGAWSLLHTNRYCLAALVMPLLVLAGASAAWIYPCAGRVILFLVPALVFPDRGWREFTAALDRHAPRGNYSGRLDPAATRGASGPARPSPRFLFEPVL